MTDQKTPSLPHKDVSHLLTQIEKSGTPLRIEGTTETYYVLSATQLMALLRSRPEIDNPINSFTPEEFGLTEADLADYTALRQARRARVDSDVLDPLDVDLARRLNQFNDAGRQVLSEEDKRELDQLVQELETVMLRNIQSAAHISD